MGEVITAVGSPDDEPKKTALQIVGEMAEFALAHPNEDQVPLVNRADVDPEHGITQAEWEQLPEDFRDFVRRNHE